MYFLRMLKVYYTRAPAEAAGPLWSVSQGLALGASRPGRESRLCQVFTKGLLLVCDRYSESTP